MFLLDRMHKFFLPSRINAFRPAVLGKTSLMFFLGLTLAVEGFLIVGLIARESDDTFLSMTQPQAASYETASVAQSGLTYTQSSVRQLIRTFDAQHTANWILGTIAVLLTVVVAVVFFMHMDVQAHDMLLGGLTAAAIALVCLLGNVYVRGSPQVPVAMVQFSGE